MMGSPQATLELLLKGDPRVTFALGVLGGLFAKTGHSFHSH